MTEDQFFASLSTKRPAPIARPDPAALRREYRELVLAIGRGEGSAHDAQALAVQLDISDDQLGRDVGAANEYARLLTLENDAKTRADDSKATVDKSQEDLRAAVNAMRGASVVTADELQRMIEHHRHLVNFHNRELTRDQERRGEATEHRLEFERAGAIFR